MGHVTVRVDDETLAVLDRVADDRRWTRSEAVRAAIEDAYGRVGPTPIDGQTEIDVPASSDHEFVQDPSVGAKRCRTCGKRL